MNEQILYKLAQQADVWCDQNYAGSEFYDLRWEEKFAELLIQQCMDLISEEAAKWQGAEDITNFKLSRHVIKEYFGVKE